MVCAHWQACTYLMHKNNDDMPKTHPPCQEQLQLQPEGLETCHVMSRALGTFFYFFLLYSLLTTIFCVDNADSCRHVTTTRKKKRLKRHIKTLKMRPPPRNSSSNSSSRAQDVLRLKPQCVFYLFIFILYIFYGQFK